MIRPLAVMSHIFKINFLFKKYRESTLTTVIQRYVKQVFVYKGVDKYLPHKFNPDQDTNYT